MQVCLNIPDKTDKQWRQFYEGLGDSPQEQRLGWFNELMKEDGVYCGRPKALGGWYVCPQVKAGSLYANPWSLKHHSLEDSLSCYENYMRARLDGKSITEIIEMLPEDMRHLLKAQFVEKNLKKGKSVAHYELNISGEELKGRMKELKGKRLGCWCISSKLCHISILMKLMEEL